MEPIFELALDLPSRDSRQLLRALHAQLRAAIVDGRLQPGLRLPPTRQFASSLGVSRNTAVASYDLLLAEGYLVSRPGAGTFVSHTLPGRSERDYSAKLAEEARLTPYWRTARPLPMSAAQIQAQAQAPRYNLQLGTPDQGQFAFDEWRRLSARALRQLARQPAAYDEPQGRPALRAAIARHVSSARAVACDPQDVLVTAGAQQAFDLLSRVLIVPGETVVAVEDPGYPPLRATLQAAGALIRPVPVDAEGLVVEQIPAEAKLIFVTPSHQFPLGVAMSARRRTALLEFARRHSAVIIEDDYDSEFRYGGRPLDALQTLDRDDSVFYVGTFSKSLFPGLRLGFMVAPPWAQRALIAAKQMTDWHCNAHMQETLAAFIAEGQLLRHVRKMRLIYDARRQILLNSLRREFAGLLEAIPSAAGLHLAAWSVGEADMDVIAQCAADVGVSVNPLQRYFIRSQGRDGLTFGFGEISEADLPEAMKLLRSCWAQ
jgi:GntR family transcriptional regulator/MocR family aminotransferase